MVSPIFVLLLFVSTAAWSLGAVSRADSKTKSHVSTLCNSQPPSSRGDSTKLIANSLDRTGALLTMLTPFHLC